VRIGLFGGTFDPPHHGHLLAASDAFEALALDRLVWIPAAQQPLKVAMQSAAAADRLAMTRLAVGDDPRFSVDPVEIERAGLSFSVDTVEGYARTRPGDELLVLLGADVLATFARWKEPRRLAQLARLAVLHRAVDGAPVEKAAIVGAISAITGADVPAPLVLETRRVDISSTEIRERARVGRSLHGFVPDAVARYIRERALYR
jgi:nicotinate-nucleotide adenylyltransferase